MVEKFTSKLNQPFKYPFSFFFRIILNVSKLWGHFCQRWFDSLQALTTLLQLQLVHSKLESFKLNNFRFERLYKMNKSLPDFSKIKFQLTVLQWYSLLWTSSRPHLGLPQLYLQRMMKQVRWWHDIFSKTTMSTRNWTTTFDDGAVIQDQYWSDAKRPIHIC